MAIDNNKKLAWNNQQAREALDRYEITVRVTAKRLKPVAALGQALDEEDLCAEGRVAVLEALSTYQGFGIEEHTWVRTRIRQRMIDAIRRLDLRSRDEIRLVVRHAAGQLGTERESERGREVAARRLISFDSIPAEAEPLANRLRDSITPMADDVVQDRARKDRLMTAIQVLPPRQRVAIELGLFEGLALREIGDRMGISESRVCQLQKRAVQHLRRAINQEVTKNAA
jgi:RNA polymerase sigma factor for flagellar operon FliA